jgi:hypothetical protein
MHQEFDDSSKAHVTRDDDHVVRDVLHVDEPLPSTAPTAVLAAREYLEKFGDVLGVSAAELTNFSLPPESEPTRAGIEYRFAHEKPQFDMTTVVFDQTYLGLPVWGAGVAVQMRTDPFVVVGAQSTRHADVAADLPSERALARAAKLTVRQLAPRLGAENEPRCEPSSLAIQRQRLVVFRYDARQRLRAHEASPEQQETSAHQHIHPSLPVPEADVPDRRHYVAIQVVFTLSWRGIPDLPWLAILDVETLSVLYLRALVDDVTGLVFREDPITANGGPPPSATAALLNAVRTSVPLELAPPVAGTYALRGPRVALIDSELPGIVAPTEPAGTNFDFPTRTNGFSAVNAYYHCDRFFRLVEELGFDRATYFTGTLFPSSVDHRGTVGPPNGIGINAHCVGNGTFGILRTTFMLADLSDIGNPLGLACDWRVVLHELGGHGILYNHVNFPNFGFSHSAGDSFAAVLNDPETRATDRFLTFPWVGSVIGRRHDRSPTTGWAWGGANDVGGYSSEQILSTTHFRLYRSLGGDAHEVATRRFAARYVAYLMLRAIGSLTPATNPSTPALYAGTLAAAERGSWTAANQVGSVYGKVIRWAFEKQGLFQPPGAPLPVIREGAPPPVDVYIDDGRHGEYPYQPRFWENRDIWNRHRPDGETDHQTPIVCRTNYAYVRVKNRGTQAAIGARVYAHHCRPSTGLVWPDDFEPMTTASLGVPGALAPGAEIVVGPFEWTPIHRGHEGMLMSVTTPSDRANNDAATATPAALGPTPAWRLVPSDNNIGFRALVPLPGGGGRCALEAAFCNRQFWAQNPFDTTARIDIRVVRDGFFTSRGWTVAFANPGGATFSLGPREARLVRPVLVGGQDFAASAVTDAGGASFTFLTLADGIVVGGLTYFLDAASSAAEETEHREGCAKREGRPRPCCQPCVDERCKPCPCLTEPDPKEACVPEPSCREHDHERHCGHQKRVRLEIALAPHPDDCGDRRRP